MPYRQEARNANSPSMRWVWMSAAVLSAASVVALLFTVSTVTVQADAPLARPASTLPPTVKWALPTPESLAPAMVAKSADMLHGVASWYGSVLNGHRTASGERFDMYAMTACHPTLPFGTLVRVTNLDNKKAVVVRINDRGILDKGRVIDLSYAAAEELKITRIGLAHVALEVVELGQPRRKSRH
jgi:rare lipoprotein A